MKTIALVVAASRNGVIGRGGGLPWRLPADVAHFKAITTGKAVVMGRKTYESIGRPLKGRFNVVVSRDPAFQAPECTVVRTVAEALAVADHEGGGDEIAVIGGAAIYAAALPRAERIHLTEILADVEGDVSLPALDPSEWREVSVRERPADAENPHAMRFVTLERRTTPLAPR